MDDPLEMGVVNTAADLLKEAKAILYAEFMPEGMR